jgi:hypothetical protein
MKYRNKLQLQKVAVKGKTTKNGRRNLQIIPQKGKGRKGQKQNSTIGVQNHTPLLH